MIVASTAVLLQRMAETADQFGNLYDKWIEPADSSEVWSELVELAHKVVDFALLRALDVRRQERTRG